VTAGLLTPGAPRAARLPRLISGGATPDSGLGEHLDRHGPPAYPARRGELIEAARAAGLTGRGGAAFPVHRKLAAVAAAGRRPVVVANGAEGEPASGKDQALLWLAPHLVLDGLQLAAAATGASRAFLYTHRDPRLAARLVGALAERSAAGLDRVAVELEQAPARFLAGEESAVVSRLSGDPARPRFKQPPVYQRGVDGAPTLVSNVETLAHLALVGRHGPGPFRAAGTAAEPGSMLVTLHLADGRATITETGLGTPLTTLLPGLAAGPGSVQAVLCGGYHGAWLTPATAAALTLSNADLRPAGAFAGAGVLAELPASRCGLAETARVARYLALESAGQCGPCFNGLPRISAALTELARTELTRTKLTRPGLAGPPPGARVLDDVRRWAGLVAGRGACHHPDGFTRFVRSALTVFAAEIDQHARGRCTATSPDPFLPVPAAAGAEADWS
jgi:NADH:ubiquinone oxidoreductase subunit F (NADH-binding)